MARRGKIDKTVTKSNTNATKASYKVRRPKVGRIIMPPFEEEGSQSLEEIKAAYLDSILESNQVSVQLDGGDYLDKVLVTFGNPYVRNYPLQEVEGLLGSVVIIDWIDGSPQKPFISRYLNNQNLPNTSTSYEGYTYSNNVTTYVDDAKGMVSFSIIADGAIFSAQLPKSNSKAIITVKELIKLISNNINIDAKEVLLRATEAINIITKDTAQFNGSSIVVGDIDSNELEPIVKGDTLESLLNDILSSIQNITVSTGFGASSTPLNSSEFTQISNDLTNMLSLKSQVE